MDRKAMARETLEIMKNGYYHAGEKHVEIRGLHEDSVKKSFLLTPTQGDALLNRCMEGEFNRGCNGESREEILVWNCSTVEAILRLHAQKKEAAVLNFASAKNPGGGFINGANAQEESLAVSGGLYRTLTVHEEYYRKNREYKSMMYTNHAIYSPNVVFFRDEHFRLMEEPVTASVLTIPAVNMGQVRLKGEDEETARHVMYRRMRLVLSIFAEKGAKNLVLGAYGCGVFRNDPVQIALWWKELLAGGLGAYFESIFHAVLDHSKNQDCIMAFRQAAE